MVHWVRVHWMNPDWKSILKNEGPLPSWLLEIPVMDYDHPGKKPTNNQPTGVERGPLLVQEHCQQMAGHVDGSVMRRKQQQLPCRSDPS